MNEVKTIRERIERATGFFEKRRAVILTTFNLNGQFFEEQVLPIVLDVESDNPSARDAEVHRKLVDTACKVYYDPSSHPKLSGKFRFVAQPVPIRGRLFHPKLVVISGVCKDDRNWVYLAVSSANLSRSGWGRNAESFGETWIHTRKQQCWGALDQFLAWIQTHLSLVDEAEKSDAVEIVRRDLKKMGKKNRLRDDGSQVWTGTLHATLYTSVFRNEGKVKFQNFPQHMKSIVGSRPPHELWVYSPYWGDPKGLIGSFDVDQTYLVPAMRRDRDALGLTKSQYETIPESAMVYRNDSEKKDDRFWHMKAYWVSRKEKTVSSVGSCNFTRAGLFGKDGNVEAMLSFKYDAQSRCRWWPSESSNPISETECSEYTIDEENTPEPIPVTIVVGYDWKDKCWRWNLEGTKSQSNYKLKLLECKWFSIRPGRNCYEGATPQFPSRFSVSYDEQIDSQTKQKMIYEGEVIELNLDHNLRSYGKPLSANDILGSWQSPVPLPGGGGSGDDGDDDNDNGDTPSEQLAFDAVNLYEFYRAARDLREKLANCRSEPESLNAWLFRRNDSVLALAKLADESHNVPTVSFLVLEELQRIVLDTDKELEPEGDNPWSVVCEMKKRAENEVRRRLAEELGSETGKRDTRKAVQILKWFNKQFKELRLNESK